MIDIAYVRQFRIGPYAIFDIAVSYLGIYLIAPILTTLFAKIHIHISRSSWMWLMMPISVVFHLIFNQNTAFIQALTKPDHYYAEAIVLVFMLYMGLKNVQSSKTKQ